METLRRMRTSHCQRTTKSSSNSAVKIWTCSRTFWRGTAKMTRTIQRMRFGDISNVIVIDNKICGQTKTVMMFITASILFANSLIHLFNLRFSNHNSSCPPSSVCPLLLPFPLGLLNFFIHEKLPQLLLLQQQQQ